MKKPLISIITICYNEKYIEKTCLSIVNQTFQDFEWIVVDGGSTDQTTLVTLEKYKKRINVFISEKDFGRYNAMNKGIKKAQGKWIIFINGGDSFYNFDVLKDVFYHKRYKGIDILYGDMVRWLKTYYSIKTNPSVLDSDYMKNNSISHPATFIQRRLFKKYGGYDESYQIVSDWAKWIEFLKGHCTFFYLGKIIASFNLDGISSQGLTPLHQQERQQVIDTCLSQDESDDYLDNRMITISSKFSLTTILRKKIKKFIKK